VSRREHDPELRDLISAGDTLHEQLARLDRSEPPEELDRIVIERARQAIRMPQLERPIRQFRWAAPIAIAATVLVSFALVLHQLGPQAPAIAPPAATTEPVIVANAPIATASRREAAQDARADAPRVAAAPPVPLAQTRSADEDGSRARARPAETRQVTPQAAPVPAPERALAKREAYESETLAASAAVESDAAAAASGTYSDPKANFRAHPDTWRAEIARLRQEGRHEEADRELAEFRRMFPKDRYAAPAAAGDIAPER
jgi:hypothetical protein